MITYDELVTRNSEQALRAEYERIYKGYEHACSFEDYLLRKQIEEESNETLLPGHRNNRS